MDSRQVDVSPDECTENADFHFTVPVASSLIYLIVIEIKKEYVI